MMNVRAGAVVRYGDPKGVPDSLGGDGDSAAFIPVLDAVMEGVFDEGLENEPGNREMPALSGKFEGADEPIAVADFLNDGVLPGVFEFFFQGDEGVAAGEASPEQSGQGGYHGDNVVFAAFGCHPDD